MKTLNWILLGVLAFLFWITYKAFSNIAKDVSDFTTGVESVPVKVWKGITSESSAIWTYLSGNDGGASPDIGGNYNINDYPSATGILTASDTSSSTTFPYLSP